MSKGGWPEYLKKSSLEQKALLCSIRDGSISEDERNQLLSEVHHFLANEAQGDSVDVQAVVLAASIKGLILESMGRIAIPDGCIDCSCARVKYPLRSYFREGQVERTVYMKAIMGIHSCCNNECPYNPVYDEMHRPRQTQIDPDKDYLPHPMAG